MEEERKERKSGQRREKQEKTDDEDDDGEDNGDDDDYEESDARSDRLSFKNCPHHADENARAQDGNLSACCHITILSACCLAKHGNP